MRRHEELEREVAELRAQVRELQRALARRSEQEEVDSIGGVAIALSEREALLTEAERIAHVGSWVWNVASDRVFWSDELYRLLGYDPDVDEASTTAFYARVHPEDRECVAAASERALRTGIAERIHFRVLHPDGLVRTVQMDGAMLFEPDGSLHRIVGTVLDHTAQLEASATRRRAEHVLQEIESVAGLGLIEVALPSGAQSWTPGVRAILGVADDVEASAASFAARTHPEDTDKIEQTRATLFHDGRARVELRMIRPSGELRYVRGLASLRHGPDGEVTGGLMIVFDVTEQHRLQQRLASAEKLEAIGRLAGGIAHDLNNLMMVVATIGFEIEPVAPKYAALLEAAVTTAGRMTQHLLSVSGNGRLELRLVCCNQLVQAACDQARGLMGEHVVLTTSLCTERAGLEVDPHQMEQVLLNLILNARDAIPGAGTIVVSARAIAEDRVEIAVEDDGVGMSDEVQARAFEPFFTTKAAGRGTGLGLALVRGTVERHGGTVELCSRPGRGTRVNIQLPRRPSVERAPSAPRDEPYTPLRVIVLDDNDMVRGALCDLLRAGGHTVDEAALPSECLALIEERWPSVDLLVCDLVMPEMLGPSLVAQLKERGICPGQVVYVTGYGAPAESMLEPGDTVLRKPFTAEQLAAAIAGRRPDTAP